MTLDSSSKTHEGLKIAKEKNIEFEQVTLNVGSAPKSISLSLGEIKISAQFLEEIIANFRTLLGTESEIPMTMAFKKVYTQTGFDLENFTKQLGIEIGHGEVEQHE